MPWEKQFDVDESLAKAMEVFRRQGYKATSMQSLTKSMKVFPGSIYATYGNKRSLFIKALEHYETEFRSWFKVYEEEKTPVEAIVAVYEFIIDEALKNPDYDGCLLVNTALEVAPHDEEIGRLVSHGLEVTEQFFRKMIQKGQQEGEISADLNARQTARVLLGLLSGLRVLSRGRPERAVLRAVAEHVESILR